GLGLEQVLAGPIVKPTVLMAPHHGSRTSNNEDLADWAQAQVVVSCQGPPKSKLHVNPYEKHGSRYLTTWKEGAVTFRMEMGAWIVETYGTQKRWELKDRP